MNKKKTVLAAAIAATIGLSASASAESLLDDQITVEYEGWYTLLNPAGDAAVINIDAPSNAFYGNRTAISGNITLNFRTGAATGTMQSFSFGGAGPVQATNISFQTIGDGQGNAGSLLLGNMGFNWSGTSKIPISVVLDASGFLDAIAGGLTTSETISGVGALAATDDFSFGSPGPGRSAYTLPLGPSPIVTTTFNTTPIGTVDLGTNPSGTLPLIDDGIGGSPNQGAPTTGFNPNFDFTKLHVTGFSHSSPVPVPAAVWLFGSGLLGLIGVARRRKS